MSMKPEASISFVFVLSRNRVITVLDFTFVLWRCCDYKWPGVLMLVHMVM